MTVTVTSAQREQFVCEGYFVVESALDAELLEIARSACNRARAGLERDMRERGENRHDSISILGSRYFLRKWRERYPELRRVLFNDTTAALCRATIGATAYLHNEQFVVNLREPTSDEFFPQSRFDQIHVVRESLRCACALLEAQDDSQLLSSPDATGSLHTAGRSAARVRTPCWLPIRPRPQECPRSIRSKNSSISRGFISTVSLSPGNLPLSASSRNAFSARILSSWI